jgi:GH15 family glucan-1,4-alpha-glucosidase
VATLQKIEDHLASGSLIHRYNTSAARSPAAVEDAIDGVGGPEGTFTVCTFWYVENLARAGRIEDARAVFENTLTYANDVGLFSEQIGPGGEALGNFPQALTHLALISAATTLDRALDLL